MKITSIASALLLAAPLVAGFTDFYGLTADQKVSSVIRLHTRWLPVIFCPLSTPRTAVAQAVVDRSSAALKPFPRAEGIGGVCARPRRSRCYTCSRSLRPILTGLHQDVPGTAAEDFIKAPAIGLTLSRAWPTMTPLWGTAARRPTNLSTRMGICLPLALRMD